MEGIARRVRPGGAERTLARGEAVLCTAKFVPSIGVLQPRAKRFTMDPSAILINRK